jgi:hypothetical protein
VLHQRLVSSHPTARATRQDGAKYMIHLTRFTSHQETLPNSSQA